MTRTAPHHPSSAELAAFRYRIAPDAIDCAAWHHLAGIGRATTSERERGIGHRGYDDPAWWWDGTSALSIARREAAAMRSRAYGLIGTRRCSGPCSITLPHRHPTS